MKLYTIDDKLLTERPEIRIGEKVYPIDDRQKTVEKIMQQIPKSEDDRDVSKTIKEVFKLAFGPTAAKEIDERNLPFAAQQQVFEIVMSAITGESPAQVNKRFQEETDTVV